MNQIRPQTRLFHPPNVCYASSATMIQDGSSFRKYGFVAKSFARLAKYCRTKHVCIQIVLVQREMETSIAELRIVKT